MTITAVTTGIAIEAWVSLGVGLLGALVALAALRGVMRPIREIDRYSKDILQAGLGIASSLDGVQDLARTRELALAAPAPAAEYLSLLGRAS